MIAANDFVVVYDNFDYLQRTRHQLIGDTGSFYSYTTGKVIRTSDIPPTGLRQRMLRYDVPLGFPDIALHEGNRFDNIQARISEFFIADALRRAYPDIIAEFCEKHAGFEYPSMVSSGDQLLPAKTQHHTLGPILEDEATIEGNYRILADIFRQQFHLTDDKHYSEVLYLVYGDQRTCQRIRACKRERLDATSAYDKHQWVLPVTGLWHLRLNFLYMIMRIFYGGAKTERQYSMLYPQINLLERRNIPADRAPFHHMEELILHSFDARIVAVFLRLIRGRCDIKNIESVRIFIRSLSPQQLIAYIAEIRQTVLEEAVIHEANRTVATSEQSRCSSASTTPAKDTEFLNHVKFLQLVETYKVLKHAIKHADIGLLKRALSRCCIYFAGSSSKNYAMELIYLWWISASSASDPVLQRAVLANGLVNQQGKANTFFEIDRLNELLNLELKDLLRSRGNSTFNVGALFRWSVLTSGYTSPACRLLERIFGERTNTDHTVKSAATDIQVLADILADESIFRADNSPQCYSAPPVLRLGIERLGQLIHSFNLARLGRLDESADSAGEEVDVFVGIAEDIALLHQLVGISAAFSNGLLADQQDPMSDLTAD